MAEVTGTSRRRRPPAVWVGAWGHVRCWLPGAHAHYLHEQLQRSAVWVFSFLTPLIVNQCLSLKTNPFPTKKAFAKAMKSFNDNGFPLCWLPYKSFRSTRDTKSEGPPASVCSFNHSPISLLPVIMSSFHSLIEEGISTPPRPGFEQYGEEYSHLTKIN